MRKGILTLCLAIKVLSLSSQGSVQPTRSREDQKLFESGQAFYQEKLYVLAYERFSALSKKFPDDGYVKYLTGICGIFITGEREASKDILEEIYSNNKKTPDIEFYLALLKHKLGDFDECIELSNKLLTTSKLKNDQIVTLKRLIENCNNAKDLVNKPLKASITNIGSPPNTKATEYSPVISSDDETMFFTYRGEKSMGGLRDFDAKEDQSGFYYEDIFVARKKDGVWQQPTPLENANTITNDAVVSISNDGQSLFTFKSTATEGGDLYESNLVGSKFSVPAKIKGDINSSSYESHISLSVNKRMAIFSSDRPGGFGGIDLYSAIKMPDGTWGKVKNLGSEINTPYDDDAPFLHPDGKTLVFSSKGHNSMGEFDIFFSDIDEIDSTWKKPTNIGYPINTVDSDIYYILSSDGKRGYFSSVRGGGYGDMDMYVVEPAIASKKSQLMIVKGKVSENMLPYGCEISVFLDNGRSFGVFKSNSVSGNYLISMPSGYNYRLGYYHPVLGERSVEVNAKEVTGYAEKEININFGDSDSIPKITEVKVEAKDSAHIVINSFNLSPIEQINTIAAVTKTIANVENKITESEESTKAVVQTKKPEASPKGNLLPEEFSAVKPKSQVVTKEKTVTKPKEVVGKVETNRSNIVNNKSASVLSDYAVAERKQLLSSFGSITIQGVKYFVQVGAYRQPQNFKPSKLNVIGSVKQKGIILGDVSLLIMDKEFDTWIEADAYLSKVKSLGQQDAFLTALISGKRFYLKDLLQRGIWERKSL
jgi:hypothetical protein